MAAILTRPQIDNRAVYLIAQSLYSGTMYTRNLATTDNNFRVS